jgi:hypothetical protein
MVGNQYGTGTKVPIAKHGETMIYTDMKMAIDNASECIVCGKLASYRGVFQPNDSQAYGAPPGKTRCCIYEALSEHVEARFEMEYGKVSAH